MSEFKIATLFCLGLLAIIAASIGGALWANSVACTAKWSDFENEWGVWTGCRVKIDGRWTPEDRVREVDI